MMKAAQGPGVGGGLPLGAPTPGSHSPNHQSMHPGICLLLNTKLNVYSECNEMNLLILQVDKAIMVQVVDHLHIFYLRDIVQHHRVHLYLNYHLVSTNIH